MLSESGEIQTLNNITRKALEVVTNLLLGYIGTRRFGLDDVELDPARAEAAVAT